ncbi:MAG TPA: DUF1697 domain-containing protein [Bryobacteraceae bacterium]|nr:DUF1697 domain-containing protein [Bryobacteraceae bacterium]
MPVIVSMLRGVNLAGHKKIGMDALRKLYESLGLRDAQTFINSGNVIFRTQGRNLAALSRRIEDAIEQSFGFRCDVIVRTIPELRDAIAGNPFAGRSGIEPGKLAVTFLASDPGQEAREKVLRIKADPEEVRIAGRELYIYYPNGMARPKLTWPTLERILKTSGTARNWNTARKLLEIAEGMEKPVSC